MPFGVIINFCVSRIKIVKFEAMYRVHCLISSIELKVRLINRREKTGNLSTKDVMWFKEDFVYVFEAKMR